MIILATNPSVARRVVAAIAKESVVSTPKYIRIDR